MPHSAITFVPLTADDRALVAGWLDGDVEGMQHLGFYRDVSAWLGLLSDDRRGWIARCDGIPIGFLDLESDGAAGFLSYYVAPEHRGRGHGTALLRGLPALCLGWGVHRVVGYVDPHNGASLAALRRAGFTVGARPDGEGMLAAVKDMAAD